MARKRSGTSISRLAEQFGARIAKQVFGLRIGQRDAACRVHHYNGAGCAFHHEARALLQNILLVDAAPDAQEGQPENHRGQRAHAHDVRLGAPGGGLCRLAALAQQRFFLLLHFADARADGVMELFAMAAGYFALRRREAAVAPQLDHFRCAAMRFASNGASVSSRCCWRGLSAVIWRNA